MFAFSTDRRTRLRSTRSIVQLLGSLLLTACSDSLSPFEPEVASNTDNFQLQATEVTGVTSTLNYPWTNTAQRATVNHSTTTTAGTAQVTIRDAAGTVVYEAALVPSLNVPTANGTSGAWTVQLRLTNYTGTLNFRVQKL